MHDTVASVIISLFFKAECVYRAQFAYPSIRGPLICFHILAVVDSAAVSIGVQIILFFWV